MSFEFPKQLPKEWLKAIQRDGKVGSEIRGLKVVGRDERGTIVHVSRDGFKILYGEENQNVFGNPLVGEGLDPNFGYQTIGASASDMESGGVGYIKGSIFTIPDAATADSITVALKRYVAGSDKFKCAIYKHSDLSLVGSTEEKTLSMTTSFAWYTFNFIDPKPSLTQNEVYLLVVWAKYTTQYLYIAWDAGDTNQGHYRAVAYNGFPNPWSPAPYHDAHKYSIYCTYTVSGAPTYINVSDSGSGVDSVVVEEFYPTLLTFKDKYVVASTTAVTTTSDTLVDDTEASQTFNLAASQVVLAIYQANNVYGAAMPFLGIQNAVNVDGVDKANSWDSGGNPNNNTRNCVFWLGTLAAGSHTIKGRFASRESGSTATISNRVLLIYIFDGDTYQYLDDSTVATAPDTTMIDDPYAQVTFTPPATCKALIMYNCANFGGVSTYESVYGKKAAINVAGTDYGQAEKGPGSANPNYVDSVFTVHALSLSAVSTTVKGRFANAGTAATVIINRRQLAVLLLADSTLMDVVTSTTQVSTTSNALVDDTEATISRTTTDARELLVVAMGTKRHGTSAGHYGECYGIKINANDRTNSRGSPPGLAYADGAATTHAEQLAAGSHTVQGRFSNNSGTETATIDARQVVALWFSGGAAPTYVNVSDSGLGADVLYNLSATLTLAESGSGTDGLDMQAALPLSDSGVGSDALQSIGLPVADVGSGVDALDMQSQLSLSDSGSGTDSPSLQGQISLEDVGSGADTSLLEGSLPLSDSGVGTDVLQSIGIPILESGVGADVPSMLGQLSLADSGLGTEYVSAGFWMEISDGGIGSDVLSLLGQISPSDVGSGIEISSLQAQLPLTDSAVGNDILQSIGLPLSDSGSGLDVPLLQGQLQLSDAGVGTDVLSQLQAQLPVSDAGLGSELFGLQGSLTLADVGNGVDSPSLLAQLLLADSGNGVDLASLTAQLSLADSGVGVDSAVASFFLTVSDSGTGVDSVSQLQAQLSLADYGVGSEGFQLQGSFTISDSGLGTEIVYAGVPGGKVTKLFLIIGDLAIQLAGS